MRTTALYMTPFTTMARLFPTSSFKTAAAVIIAGIFTVAVAVCFTVPSVSHFMASCYPMIHDNTVFLLKPPYLYLVINCIIVSIVATSKLTHKPSSNNDFSEVVPLPSDIVIRYLNVAHDYTELVDNDPTVKDLSQVVEGDKVKVDDVDDHKPATEKPKLTSDSLETSRVKLSRKPPRYSQQKSLKTSAQGGGDKKPPRRQDTLETTWKKITEGHSTPLTKHLTKSDTWQERSHVRSSSEKSAKQKKMTKSENLDDINAPTELKREASPGQEELNRRVEAFIKKFNEEMRLQRLESLAKINKMENGATCL
ncbi:unnamed protein product [Eruca vesicaria subsp. sativa]|uniref:DUF4408 domain-containing protein n=1 Tax=Eruca vesicaria subsp. sativa TaxID=29727 RepID=A0ABC8KKD6_ERUVS|nr:unnamed protein product [Eruca vesicaria subsp. sativa]